MLNKIFNYLSAISYNDFDIGVNNLHIAFLCSNNRIFFIGKNSPRTKVSSLNYEYKSLHAEIDAIKKFKSNFGQYKSAFGCSKTLEVKKKFNILCC